MNRFLLSKQQNNSLVSDVYVGDDGKLHKVIGGADTVLNFKSKADDSGEVTVSLNSYPAYSSEIITFNKSFSFAPYIYLETGTNICALIENITKTNFTINAINYRQSNRIDTIKWYAFSNALK